MKHFTLSAVTQAVQILSIGSTDLNINQPNEPSKIDSGDDCRPLAILDRYMRRFPTAQRSFETMRRARGKKLPDWPEWCYVPTVGAEAVVILKRETNCRIPPKKDAVALAGLVAWLNTQGIYRFAPDLIEGVVEESIGDDISPTLLHLMPEWCVYVETPGLIGAKTMHGFFAFLNYDLTSRRTLLWLLVDMSPALKFICVSFATNASTECRNADQQSLQSTIDIWLPREDVEEESPETALQLYRLAEAMVKLVLFICSQNAKITCAGNSDSSSYVYRVEPTTHASQFKGPRKWTVTSRIGSAPWRSRLHGDSTASQSPERTLRPHVRRAHWHGFWTGSKESGNRRFHRRWLAPIAVKVIDVTDLPATIRPVKYE